jgi:hypothetical protein
VRIVLHGKTSPTNTIWNKTSKKVEERGEETKGGLSIENHEYKRMELLKSDWKRTGRDRKRCKCAASVLLPKTRFRRKLIT